jgi:replicative DNA helicase
MIDKAHIPPQDLQIERAVLASMLCDRDACAVGLEMLGVDTFYASDNKAVFGAIVSVSGASLPIDMITVSEELKKRGFLGTHGPECYVTSLMTDFASYANIDSHCKILIQKEMLRTLVNSCQEILTEAMSGEAECDDIVDRAGAKIFALGERRVTGQLMPTKQILSRVFDDIERFQKGVACGIIKTGLKKLDEATGGFNPADLVIVAGRPGSGKSSLAGQIALNAGKAGVPSAVFSLEMTSNNYVQRILCSESGVDLKRCRSGKLAMKEFDSLGKAAVPVAEIPVYIDDTPGVNIMEVRAKSRRAKLKWGIQLIIIDYLQYMTPLEKTRSREQDVSGISRGLKMLAKELNIPVIVLSQLSRDCEKRPDHHPMLSDLRESGGIEQDADTVIFCHRPWLHSGKDEDRNIAELIIGKQRNGPVGMARVSFVDSITKFCDLETESKPEETNCANGW